MHEIRASTVYTQFSAFAQMRAYIVHVAFFFAFSSKGWEKKIYQIKRKTLINSLRF